MVKGNEERFTSLFYLSFILSYLSYFSYLRVAALLSKREHADI